MSFTRYPRLRCAGLCTNYLNRFWASNKRRYVHIVTNVQVSAIPADLGPSAIEFVFNELIDFVYLNSAVGEGIKYAPGCVWGYVLCVCMSLCVGRVYVLCGGVCVEVTKCNVGNWPISCTCITSSAHYPTKHWAYLYVFAGQAKIRQHLH